MTTIAWDGQTIAADRCRVSGSGMRQTAIKLLDAGDFVFAMCGNYETIPMVERWLKGGAQWDDRPEFTEDSNGGVVVRKSDAALFLVQGKRATLVPIPPGPTAIGSGSPFAVTAMHLGKTAVEAVEIASLFDDGTGLGVDSVAVAQEKRP